MKIENDIRKFLIRNSIVTYSMGVVALSAIIFAMLFSRSVLNESRRLVYLINNEGEVVPLKITESRESQIIEMKSHLTMFVDNYYNLTQYDWERKTNKALWLGNLTADYNNRYATGYYSGLMQFNVERLAELRPEDIELFSGENGKVGFKITIPLTERINNVDRRFLVFAQGTLRKVPRNFPYNPHGFFIDNFMEEKTIEVKQ